MSNNLRYFQVESKRLISDALRNLAIDKYYKRYIVDHNILSFITSNLDPGVDHILQESAITSLWYLLYQSKESGIVVKKELKKSGIVDHIHSNIESCRSISCLRLLLNAQKQLCLCCLLSLSPMLCEKTDTQVESSNEEFFFRTPSLKGVKFF